MSNVHNPIYNSAEEFNSLNKNRVVRIIGLVVYDKTDNMEIHKKKGVGSYISTHASATCTNSTHITNVSNFDDYLHITREDNQNNFVTPNRFNLSKN